MNDAVIVLNAGSSSLKFSIYRVVGAELTVDENAVGGLEPGDIPGLRRGRVFEFHR